jgi:glycosyltransferase involved in cell wall biosynthesis
MSKVDVIIPAYNAAKYLPIAISSVIGQTFVDWTILLIDDGSTDNTPEVVAPFIDQLGSKLKYIRKENGGLPAARNTAIRNSSSEFLALLDADHVWFPSRLAESLKCFEDRPQVGLSYSYVTLIDENGETLKICDEPQRNGEGWIAPYIYMRRVHLPCPTVTYRRKCIDEVGMFDETLRAAEDRDLALRIALRYEVALSPKILAQYRVTAGSMSTDSERMLNAQLQFIEKHFGAPGCGVEERRVAQSRCYRHYAESLQSRGRMAAALRSSARSLKLSPLDLGNVRTAASLLLNFFRGGRQALPVREP